MLWDRAERWLRYEAAPWLRWTIIITLFVAWAFGVSAFTIHFMPK